MFALSATILGSVGLLYGLLLPLVIALVLALLLFPALLVTGARPRAVCRAIYCYVLQGIGVLLMTIAGLPAIYGVLAGVTFQDGNTYLALLIIFTIGGLTFLWHDHLAKKIDESARIIPSVIFTYTFKLLGYLLTILALLSLVLTMLMKAQPLAMGWWVMPTIVLFYGLLLAWVTREATWNNSQFQKAPVGTHKMIAKSGSKKK